ncbi:hypothetical protein ABIC47_002059 [Leifsonia sp. 563]|uniref:hypothetical protein n=1 Tax=Leifsonia sp. 563 TaxID=3156412 RepID=UPI00339B01AF
MSARWRTYPQIGSTHKNGDRMYGFTSGYAADLMAAGTSTVSSLLGTSITAAIKNVDVGDELEVVFLGDRWVARLNGIDVGRLTWSAKRRGEPNAVNGAPLWDLDDGVLHVERVTVNHDGEVIDIGGYVTLKNEDSR